MDHESDPLEECCTKTELEDKVKWTTPNTMRLIEVYKRECPELWDTKNPLNKDKTVRQARQEYLAELFGTTTEEVNRKIHNLRCQFNAEMRKMKRRRELGGEAVGVSGWEYFDALSFIVPPAPSAPPTTAQLPAAEGDDTNDSSSSAPPPYTIDGINIALAEFQAEEDEQFRTRIRCRQTPPPPAPLSPPPPRRAPTPSTPAAAHAPSPSLRWRWIDGYSPSINANTKPDECQIFGNFVASELRTLRSEECRKKLKRMVQKAILEVGEEDYQSFR